MKSKIKVGLALLGLLLFTTNAISQTEKKESATSSVPVCGSGEKPYRDFDFVIGNWDFYTPDGTKIGEQIYTKREQDCLILEEWKLNSGGTGLGMTFVDPKSGLWHQVWMSPMFHIDYSGGLDEKGAMVLEGTIYPNNGDKSSAIRGIWARETDGSVKQEFFVLIDKTNTWEILFAGLARPKTVK